VVVAHRGDINPVDGYPENTLESCLLAASRGARVIEVDVQRSSDGTWYLMHDDTVNRTTNGAGALGSLSDAAINALIINGGLGYDAGRHRTALKVPTLASVLEAMEPFGVLVWLDNKVD